MTDLLLDVWNDLREKRLAPVAILLAVALVAVPLLLGGGGSSADPAPAAATATQPKQQAPLVKAADEAKGGASDLGVFNPKDPFKPAIEPPPPGSGTATVEKPSDSPDKGGGSGSGPGEEKPGSGGGSPITPGAPGPAPVAPPSEGGRKSYTYVADIRFGRAGRERRHRGVTRLAILPSARNPMLVFMGVTADRKRAVFLLDSTSSQAGEGSCKPSGSTCSFLYLSAADDRDQHFFTDSVGRDYGIHLLRLRRQEVRSGKASRARASRRGGRRKGGRKPDSEAASLFHLPVLIDEETTP